MAVTTRERIVVKIGGEVLQSDDLPALAKDVATLSQSAQVMVVHGGGPQATALQSRLGLKANQLGGRRVTDKATLDVMKMVLAGKLNVDLCSALLAAGARPLGLHGASGPCIRAVKRPPRAITGGGPALVDLGLVGDVVGFDLGLFELLLTAGYLPVLACLGADDTGAVFNINADIVGNQLASAFKADHLFLVTSAPGVLRDVKDLGSRIPTLTVREAQQAIADGVVKGGMIPKLEEAISVLQQGVGAIHILGRLTPGELLRERERPGSVGTALVL